MALVQKKEVKILVPGKLASEMKTAFETLANNITPENILLLADKSKKPGMNQKIQKFKAFM